VTFASGVSFDAERHEYVLNGKRLSGVTGLITERLNLNMPELFTEEARVEGLHIHRAVQKWLETGDSGSAHPGVAWIMHTLGDRWKARYSEVLVTDFKRYASSVDIVGENADGSVDIFDIKKGLFKREYVSWQLGIYKYFIEEYGKGRVGKCVCICVKDKEYYPVFPKAKEAVEGLLYG
jgi:hypothetical protein